MKIYQQPLYFHVLPRKAGQCFANPLSFQEPLLITEIKENEKKQYRGIVL